MCVNTTWAALAVLSADNHLKTLGSSSTKGRRRSEPTSVIWDSNNADMNFYMFLLLLFRVLNSSQSRWGGEHGVTSITDHSNPCLAFCFPTIYSRPWTIQFKFLLHMTRRIKFFFCILCCGFQEKVKLQMAILNLHFHNKSIIFISEEWTTNGTRVNSMTLIISWWFIDTRVLIMRTRMRMKSGSAKYNNIIC